MCLLNRFFIITDTSCPIFDLGYIFMRLFGYARVSTSQQ
ncbi:recombinase family protein, partial [Escherichia coli]|nr:recombinase family protein [Escherichia coli]